MTYSGYSSAAYTYSYDVRGNITEVRKNGSLVASYAYDDLNQLVRENNVTAGKTWVYTYDERGNILSRKTYAYTTGTLGTVQNTDNYEYFAQSSEYLWGDGLLRYDSTEYNFYDTIGNPLTYNNSSAYTFTWQNGRQLASGTKGTTSFAYTYNADGLRTQKVVDGVVTDYYWAGSQLAIMVITNGTTVKTLKFYYDAEGRPMCLDYNGTMYFYITNLQGDVVALSDQYGEVIRYEYDAWGKPIVSEYYFSSHSEVMQYNPLRYRGYIYDAETGFYYLQSRYYDPTVGRFISSDGVMSGAGGDIRGYNLYAYCFNNPVNQSDSSGNWPSKSTLLKAAAIAITAGVVVAAVAATVVTCGASSIAATIVISSAITITAKAIEVAALQCKKSIDEGKNTGQVATDIIESVFDNGIGIVAKKVIGKTIGYSTGFFSQSQSFKDVMQLQKIDGYSLKVLTGSIAYEITNRFSNFRYCISANATKGSMVTAYVFAGLDVVNMVISIFSNDPEERAQKRGYTLQ